MADENPLKAVLARHGINDPMAYLLSEEGENPQHSRRRHPDVTMRGSVYMMLDRVLDTDTVSKRLAKLRRA